MNAKNAMNSHRHSFHTFCLATIVYNILVIVAEVVLQILFVAHDIDDVLHFELFVQLFHIGGTILLGVLQWWIMHRIAKQTAWKFASLSVVMVLIHMVFLHVLPRMWGIMMHNHHHNEIKEVIVLIGIVILVTVLFWNRENWLLRWGLKNKRHINLRKIHF